jgi:hypothetical protein
VVAGNPLSTTRVATAVSAIRVERAARTKSPVGFSSRVAVSDATRWPVVGAIVVAGLAEISGDGASFVAEAPTLGWRDMAVAAAIGNASPAG